MENDAAEQPKPKKPRRWLRGVLIAIVAMAVLGAVLDSSSPNESIPTESAGTSAADAADEPAEPEMSPEEQARHDALQFAAKAFGIVKDESNRTESGIISFGYDQEEMFTIIEYRYYPWSDRDFRRRLGSHLTDKLTDLYALSDMFEAVEVQVVLPFIDIYGNEIWRTGAIIEADRQTISRVNPSNFDGVNFWRIVEVEFMDHSIDWD